MMEMGKVPYKQIAIWVPNLNVQFKKFVIGICTRQIYVDLGLTLLVLKCYVFQ